MAVFAVENPTFQPAMRIVSAITNANPATITTTFDHDYITGLVVRLLVPSNYYGMTQADKIDGLITVTGPTTFTIDIDTTSFDQFVVPLIPPGDRQHSQVVPVTGATQNVLPY